ncbi:MAG: IS256 family transposase, partial [Gammaproteobacteria bacterium]|nr:IS256 family transposase [Gammaproteobacteria bacterium]
MKKNTVVELKGRDTLTDPVIELLITGARQLIKQAIEVELQGFMSQYSAHQTEDGKAIVVRNGYLPE